MEGVRTEIMRWEEIRGRKLQETLSPTELEFEIFIVMQAVQGIIIPRAPMYPPLHTLWMSAKFIAQFTVRNIEERSFAARETIALTQDHDCFEDLFLDNCPLYLAVHPSY